MKTLTLVALLSVAGGNSPNIAPLLREVNKNTIEGQFIVIFKEQASPKEVEFHRLFMKTLMLNTTNPSDEILHEYSIGKLFRGYSAIMDERLLRRVRGMTEVKYVARNEMVRVQQSQCDQVQLEATWGLVRTTYHEWEEIIGPYPDDYRHNKEDGSGVEVYIIDSGIDLTHPLFEGRALRGFDFVDDPPVEGDPNGHGTFLAGIVMADVYGLARSTTAIDVRIINAAGVGTVAALIAGIDYVADKKNSGDSKKIVANIGVGGGRNVAVNDAVNACVDQGVSIVVPTGNEFSDACLFSPASAEDAFTVGGTDINDNWFGNTGTCVDIFAPASSITSTRPDNTTATISGTSNGSAHVAGVIAKILATTDDYDDDPRGLKEFVKSISTKDKLKNLPSDTPNEIVFFKSCE